MNKPKKSLRVREITAWHLAGFSPHAGPHVRTHQCEHSLFIHVWTFGAGPQCGTRSADPHTRTRQCECTLIGPWSSQPQEKIMSIIRPFIAVHREKKINKNANNLPKL